MKGLVTITLFLAVVANMAVPLTQHLIGLAFADVQNGTAVKRLIDGSIDLSGAWSWVFILLAFTASRGVVAWFFVVASFALAQGLLHQLRLNIFR